MYRTTLPQDVIEYVEEKFIENNGQIDKKNTAIEVMELFDISNKTVDAVRQQIGYLCKQIDLESDRIIDETESAIKELQENIEPEQPRYEIYNIDGKDYFRIFYTKVDGMTGEEIKRPVEIPLDDDSGHSLLDICFDYARKGNDMTQLELMKKHRLSPEVWHKIKSAIPLYKASDPTPDVILKIRRDNRTEEEIEKRLEKQAERSLDKYRIKEERIRNTRKEKEYEKGIKILLDFNYRMELVQEAIRDLEPLEIGEVRPHPEENDGHLTVAFSDLHMGEKTSEVIQNLQKMTQTLVNRPEKNINMLCLGDLVETLVIGGMHIGQVERMDGKFGIKLIKETVRSLERMIKTLEENGKRVDFHGITGNHDRLGKSHNEDPDRTGALVIYEMLLLRLQNLEAQVTYYEDRVNKLILGNVEYIFAHGEDGFDRRADKRPTEVFWENSEKEAKHRVIMYGHLHNFSQQNPSKNSHVIRLPALHPGGHYGNQINKSANSGFVIIKEGDQEIDFTTKYI